MRKCLVIELQMEQLNVDLDMKDIIRSNLSELFLFSPPFWSTKRSNPRKCPLEESLCLNCLLFKTHVILTGIKKKYCGAGCLFVFVFALFSFQCESAELKSCFLVCLTEMYFAYFNICVLNPFSYQQKSRSVSFISLCVF